ncbi:MAG TPA: aminotransferase class I/II-fold pyridoxal phosphate-dependent enzyme, partial [Solirubrobacterales bacterium]
STAPPPPSVGAAIAALAVLESEPELVERLQANAELLRRSLSAEGLEVGKSTTQVVPVRVGEAETTMQLCESALEQGVFAQGIRPPTVPEGSCRLRLTAMATHRKEDLVAAAHMVGVAAREMGLVGTQQLAA